MGRPKGSKNSKAGGTNGIVFDRPEDNTPVATATGGLQPSKADAQALALALDSIRDQYGNDGIIYTGESLDTLRNREVYTTGVFSVDQVVSRRGGIPAGRIVEIYGNKSSGKSTLGLHTIAAVQRLGYHGLYFDLENALDIGLADQMGVNTSEEMFTVFKPEYGEQAIDILIKMARSNAVGIAVVDSVAALVPKVRIEKSMENAVMGNRAKLLSDGLSVLNTILSRPQSKMIVIFINQIRKNLSGFGNPNVTPGGEALGFYASVILEMRVTEVLRSTASEGLPYGQMVHIKNIKNKVDLPLRECDVLLRFGEGFDRASDLISVGTEMGIIHKGGAWYEYEKEKFQGEEKLRQWLLADPMRLSTLHTNLTTLTKG